MSPKRPDQPKKPPVRARHRDDEPATTRRPSRDAPRSDPAGATKYSLQQKLDIFSRLFRGRPDVYPVRWENATGSRTRSGKGAHLWLFFSEPVRAKDARELGDLLIEKAQELRPSLVLRSHDRMFPSQDSVAKGGLGNLIALPLQREPRRRGNSAFVDANLEPYPDEQQWDVLASSRIRD